MEDIKGWIPPTIKMIHSIGTLKLYDNASKFSYLFVNTGTDNAHCIINELALTVINPTGKSTTFISNLEKITDGYSTTYQDSEFLLNLDRAGEYKLCFKLSYSQRSLRPIIESGGTFYATAYIYVNPEDSKELKPYTLGDTIRRILNLTPTRTVGEKNKYIFDPVQLAEYDKEESPEFAFTGHTLFEALLIIAQYKGAFPVLKDGVISFRKLWNGEQLTEKDLPKAIDEVSCSDINQYCTYIETEVQNLVGINDSQSGSIIEPYEGGYKTTRSNGSSAISQDTAVISTDYNQYLHIKEEIGYIGDRLPENNDITPYIYERGDYSALSDKTGAYPNSKAYALQWEQMGKNITELAHRIGKENELSSAFTEPAIANIIQAKTGLKYSDGIVNYLSQLIGLKNSNSFADLMFRTTYVPVINSRIKQYKDYFGNFNHDGSLKYNQTAELVDSEMYGEYSKQLIRKLGNVTKRKIYIFDRIDDVPKVGTVVDGNSIYDVNMSIREDKVIATIYFVKYAELSQYIGVKNPWKDSDVSTEKCYNRQISINEFIMFSHNNSRESTSEMISGDALQWLLPKTLLNDLGKTWALTCVEATGYMSDGSKLNTVLLPVVSLAIGNSIMFQWGYQNNYSAGYKSEEAPDGATDVLSGTKYNRAQKAVKYTDMYGKMETYDFGLMRVGPLCDEGFIWVDGVDGDWIPEITSYTGEISFEIIQSMQVRVQLSEAYNVDVTVKFSVTSESGKQREYEATIRAGTTEKDVICGEMIPVKSATLISASCYNTEGKTVYTSEYDVARMIGNSLPQKPSELRQASDMSEWKGAEYLSVQNLRVEKNSSEALTFSVQVHFCAGLGMENFIVGSGLSNFCPLIGGSVQDMAIFGFTERINIFNRRFSVKEEDLLVGFNGLDSIIKYNEEKNRIDISLPETINNYQAWALMGKDKNGNWQIMFGENRDLKGTVFSTVLYLLPMHSLEDII